LPELLCGEGRRRSQDEKISKDMLELTVHIVEGKKSFVHLAGKRFDVGSEDLKQIAPSRGPLRSWRKRFCSPEDRPRLVQMH